MRRNRPRSEKKQLHSGRNARMIRRYLSERDALVVERLDRLAAIDIVEIDMTNEARQVLSELKLRRAA